MHAAGKADLYNFFIISQTSSDSYKQSDLVSKSTIFVINYNQTKPVMLIFRQGSIRNMKINEATIRKLESLRKSQALSRYELAQKAGIPYSTLKNLLGPDPNPTIRTLHSLCVALDVSVREFFNDDSFNANESCDE